MASAVVDEKLTKILPKSCYLSSESEDEESFVVLSKSLSPNDIGGEILMKSNVIQESLDWTSTMLKSLKEEDKDSSDLPTISQLEKPSESVILSNGAISIASSVSMDLSPEDIQQKIDCLIDENIKLKEYLHQNNLAMKKKYETLNLWYDEVLKVHDSHKQKFTETKAYIEKLKVENGQLVLALENYKEQNEKLLKELEKNKEDLNLNKTQHLMELEESKKEAVKLKDDMEKIEDTIKQKCEKQKVELLKSSFDNVKQFEAEIAQKKIASLESQLATAQAENEELKNSLSEITCLKKKLAEEHDVVEKLKMDIDTQTRNHTLTLHKLMEENKTLHENIEKDSQDKNAEEMYQKTLEQLTAAQIHITKMELMRKEDMEIIGKKQEEIQRLEQFLTDKKSDVDIIIALRAQLDLYKSDFDIERHQKETFKSEKEQLADELVHLQRRNEQLLREVEKFRNGEFVLVENEMPTSSAPQEEPPLYKYPCPKCNFRFKDYQSLENHVYRCIELDDHLP